MRYVSSRALSLTLLSCLALTSIQSLYAAEKQEVAGEVVSVKGMVFIRQDGRASSGAPRAAQPGDVLRANDLINTASNGSVKLLMKDKTIVDLGASALFKIDKYKHNGGSDREVEMNMVYGTLRGAVTQKVTGKGKFHLKTPTATMGVRGTEFVVKSEVKSLDEMKHAVTKPGTAMTPPPGSPESKPGAPKQEVAKTEITVLQGKVEVAQKPSELEKKANPGAAAPKAVALTAGTQLVTTSADAAKGDKMEAPKITKLDTTQLQQVSASAKVADNTFQNAVVIDTSADSGSQSGGSQGKGDRAGGPDGAGRGPAGKEGPGPMGGAGAATLAALSVALEAPAMAPQVSIGDIGIAGTFGAMNVPQMAAPIPQAAIGTSMGGMRRVKITILE